MTDKQFEQIESISKKLWGDINNGHEYSMVTYTEFLGIVTEVWEGLQEEPASDDLEEASKNYALNNTPWDDCKDEMQDSFKAGAKWQKEHSWKSADGNDLPEIDKEVVVLIQPYPLENSEYAVSFAHRPNPNGWDGKSITTGKVEHFTPKTYGKGGWNAPDIAYWLDVKLPKEIEL